MEPRKAAIICRKVRVHNGTPRAVLEHARRLTGRQWSVHIIGDDLDGAAIREAGAVPRLIPTWLWPSFLRAKFFSYQVQRLVLSEHFDLVHGHGDSFAQDVLSLHNCVHAAHEAIWKTS